MVFKDAETIEDLANGFRVIQMEGAVAMVNALPEIFCSPPEKTYFGYEQWAQVLDVKFLMGGMADVFSGGKFKSGLDFLPNCNR